MRCPAVIFLVFNRPELTERVFARIREARPQQLFIVADGPRPDREGEAGKCRRVRELIERGIDWPCEVVRDYSDTNLGCGRRVSSGISNAFQQVEEAIVLEDDCLPDPTFFRFCSELLERYRSVPLIGHIGGSNFSHSSQAGSYRVSRYGHVWGWATWRRAWANYDLQMRDWPEVRKSGWSRSYLGELAPAAYWTEMFDGAYTGRIRTWDYQWIYSLWRRNCLSIVPGVNLVQNIGFGADSSHTGSADAWLSRRTNAMGFPMMHPERVARDVEADRSTERMLYSGGSLKKLRLLFRQCAKRWRLLA